MESGLGVKVEPAEVKGYTHHIHGDAPLALSNHPLAASDEDIDLHGYGDLVALGAGGLEWMTVYDQARLHQSHGNQTP